MSRHEGVSCDSCLKGNFRGKRYKCLICYDYDLCSTCYEAGATSTRHTTEHPMQCILTRADFDLYYGGEALSSEQPQSFTCPYCGKLGFTENSLQEHVTSEHSEVNFEVVCPVCASMPVGDPNLVTDDFAGHLTLEHRNPTRDLISFLDEPSSRHGVRRVPPPASRGIATRARRSNINFSSSGTLASISPSSRDNVDPIAELLSQLSGVRRTQGSTPSQLQHLQMQLQLERQQVRAARQQLERMPRRPTGSQLHITAPVSGCGTSISYISSSSSNESVSNSPKLLLSRYLEKNLSESELEKAEEERADRCLFVRDLIFGSLSEPQCDLNEKMFSLLKIADKSNTDIFSKGLSTKLQDEAAQQQLERMSRRPTGSQLHTTAPVSGCGESISVDYISSASNESVSKSPKLLLSRYLEKNLSESELEKAEVERADRCLFVRDLIFGSVNEPQCDLETMFSQLKVANKSYTDVFSEGLSTKLQDEVSTSVFTTASPISPSKKESLDSKEPMFNNDSQRKQIQDDHGISESFQAAN